METPSINKTRWIPFSWLFTWRLARRVLIIFGCLATLIVLFYAEENWRGRHAMNQYKAELQAHGETLNLLELAPPSIPDDQNMAMHPLWKGVFDSKIDPVTKSEQWSETGPFTNELFHVFKSKERRDEPFPWGNWVEARKTSMVQLQEYYRGTNLVGKLEFPVAPQPQLPGEDVLFALSQNEQGLALVRESAQRPFCRFPLRYDKKWLVLLPHLARMKEVTQVLRVHSLAELSLNQPDKAFEDVHLVYRMMDGARGEPILISQLVRIAMNTLMMQPIWEGLADHRWTEAQLIALDHDLAPLDFLKDYLLSIKGERACVSDSIEYIKTQSTKLSHVGLADDTSDRSMEIIIWLLAPRGWYDQNELVTARLISYNLQSVDVEHHKVLFDGVKESADKLNFEIQHVGVFNYAAIRMVPALSGAVKKFAMAQNAVDMARIACNLERYRLASGQYPDKLEALMPKFMTSIPNDVINGKPLAYRLNPDGTFLLYSVGWNQKDDGGKIAWREVIPSKTREVYPPKPNPDEGDWVWHY